MGHTVEIKKGFPGWLCYYYPIWPAWKKKPKLHPRHKQTSMPWPEYVNYQMDRLNIYIDSQYALGVVHDSRMLQKQKGFLMSSGAQSKMGNKWVIFLLLFSHLLKLLSSKLRLTLKDWTWVSGECPSQLSCKGNSKKSIKILANIDEIHSEKKKMTPHCQIFAILMSM